MDTVSAGVVAGGVAAGVGVPVAVGGVGAGVGVPVVVSSAVLSGTGAPHGARCLMDTVDSRPSVCRMCAYCGLACNSSTSSTNGSVLLART